MLHTGRRTVAGVRVVKWAKGSVRHRPFRSIQGRRTPVSRFSSLSNNRPSVPAADDRRGRVTRPNPRRTHNPRASGTRPVGTVCSLVAAYEAIPYREPRTKVRQPNFAG